MTPEESDKAVRARIEGFIGELDRCHQRLLAVHRDMAHRNPESKEVKELFAQFNNCNQRIFDLKNAWYG